MKAEGFRHLYGAALAAEEVADRAVIPCLASANELREDDAEILERLVRHRSTCLSLLLDLVDSPPTRTFELDAPPIRRLRADSAFVANVAHSETLSGSLCGLRTQP